MKIRIIGDKKKLPRELKKTISLKADAIKKHFMLDDKDILLDLEGYFDEFEIIFSGGLTRTIEVIHLAEFTDIDTLADYSCMSDCYLWRWL